MRLVKTPHGTLRHVGGRRKPSITSRTHPDLVRSIRRYQTTIRAALPSPPSSFDFTGPALGALRDVLANNRLGDCTCAAVCHIEDAISASGGAPVVLGEADAVKLYELACGYNPSDPSTDQGGDEYSVLSFWKDRGIDGQGAHKIAGFVAIDPHDADLVKACAYLFENLYFGSSLPDAWLSTPNGGTWDVGPTDDKNGHAFCAVGGSPVGIVVDTWGEFITITWAAIDQCVDELYCVLTPEIVNRAQQKAPSGLDWDSLVEEFDALALPVPPTVGGTFPGPGGGPLGPAVP